MEVQSGSVVNKTVIDNKIGTVTLFAFDSGLRVERTHGAL